LMLSASATDEPPYFCTIRLTVVLQENSGIQRLSIPGGRDPDAPCDGRPGRLARSRRAGSGAGSVLHCEGHQRHRGGGDSR
jgi:hypothetical protein